MELHTQEALEEQVSVMIQLTSPMTRTLTGNRTIVTPHLSQVDGNCTKLTPNTRMAGCNTGPETLLEALHFSSCVCQAHR